MQKQNSVENEYFMIALHNYNVDSKLKDIVENVENDTHSNKHDSNDKIIENWIQSKHMKMSTSVIYIEDNLMYWEICKKHVSGARAASFRLLLVHLIEG